MQKVKKNGKKNYQNFRIQSDNKACEADTYQNEKERKPHLIKPYLNYFVMKLKKYSKKVFLLRLIL